MSSDAKDATDIADNAKIIDTARTCCVDDITVDFARRKVIDRHHQVIALSALSFDTLCALIKVSPTVVSPN